MGIYAYGEEYVELAQRTLGDMLDYAVNTLSLELETYWRIFLTSRISKEYEKGNPTYVVGMNGCELADKILENTILEKKAKHEMYLDKSPEYWCGWAIAFYQWYRSCSFSKIQKAVPIHTIINMYSTMHEADILRFVEAIDEKMKDYYTDTNLKYYRKLNGYSQSQLAGESGVSLRQIQMLEQRRRNINKAGLEIVMRLARTLHCQAEDLYEVDYY